MVWQPNPHLASFPCGGFSDAVRGLNVSDEGSYSKAAHPQPPLSANLLSSLTMKWAFSRVPGTVVGTVAVLLFSGVQWIFTALEPFGKGLPFPGMPVRYASIITGLARIIATAPSL